MVYDFLVMVEPSIWYSFEQASFSIEDGVLKVYRNINNEVCIVSLFSSGCWKQVTTMHESHKWEGTHNALREE